MRSVTSARTNGYRRYAYKCRLCKKWHLATGDHNVSGVEYFRKKQQEELNNFPNLLSE